MSMPSFNSEQTLLTSTSRTTTQTSADILNDANTSSLLVVLDTTIIGTGSITVSIDGKDAVSGKYYNLLTGAAVITNTTNVYTVSPWLPAVANVTAQKLIPMNFRIVVTANNANAATYTVGYVLTKG